MLQALDLTLAEAGIPMSATTRQKYAAEMAELRGQRAQLRETLAASSRTYGREVIWSALSMVGQYINPCMLSTPPLQSALVVVGRVVWSCAVVHELDGQHYPDNLGSPGAFPSVSRVPRHSGYFEHPQDFWPVARFVRGTIFDPHRGHRFSSISALIGPPTVSAV